MISGPDTAKRWVDLLGRLHHGFLVRPWFSNVAKALRKEPKWFLVEVKTGDTRLSPALAHFQAQTRARHAFQLVMDLPFQRADAFGRTDPVVVPARTLLSQLP